MLKKYLTLIIALLLVTFTFSGCGGKTPTEVTTAYLDALKAQDFQTAAQYYNGDINTLDLTKREELSTNSFQSKNVTTLLNKLFSFEYSLSNEKVTDDKATVDVTIKTYNFAAVVEESIKEYFRQMLSSILVPQTEEDSYARMEKILMEKMDTATFDYIETVPLTLTKDKEGWKIDTLDEKGEFVNAMLGGLIELGNKSESSFDGVF